MRLCAFSVRALLECIWNVMAHTQKPDFVFWQKGRVRLNRQGVSVQSTTGSRGVHVSGSNAGYTMFWGSVNSTGYPLHPPVSPSLPLLYITICHHISTRLYPLTSTYAVTTQKATIWALTALETNLYVFNLLFLYNKT